LSFGGGEPLGLTFGIGFAAQTRFNASLKGIAGASGTSGLGGFALDMDKYYLALGKFVNEFAHAEADMFVLLIMTANVPIATGQALFSGTRVRDSISFIKRIYETRGSEPTARMADVFSQLTSIATARDHILHMGVYETREDGLMISSNQMRAHAKRAIRELDASPESLNAMTEDLRVISMWLFGQQIVEKKPGLPHAEDAVRKHRGREPAPWRYKPAQSSKPGPQTPKTTRKPKAQPPASQA
jgi:hypothetical protein